MKQEKLYKIYLPDGKALKLWFIGKQLEEILNAYNIRYEIIEK